MKLLVTLRLPSECYKNHSGQTIYMARDPATGIDKKQTKNTKQEQQQNLDFTHNLNT